MKSFLEVIYRPNFYIKPYFGDWALPQPSYKKPTLFCPFVTAGSYLRRFSCTDSILMHLQSVILYPSYARRLDTNKYSVKEGVKQYYVIIILYNLGCKLCNEVEIKQLGLSSQKIRFFTFAAARTLKPTTLKRVLFLFVYFCIYVYKYVSIRSLKPAAESCTISGIISSTMSQKVVIEINQVGLCFLLAFVTI